MNILENWIVRSVMEHLGVLKRDRLNLSKTEGSVSLELHQPFLD